MRALLAYARSDPSQLQLEDVPIPQVGPGDVLVRVEASGVSPGELDWPGAWLNHDGTPRMPPIIPGHEVAGIVDRLGPATSGVVVGDEVFGYIDVRRDGADAEYVAVRADELAPKPASLTHAQSAAIPLSALTAWQALFDHADLAPGQRILIHGGAGGVGTYAVQLARWRGASVVATSSSRDHDLLRALGADEVIDYRTQPFEHVVSDMDVVFDTVGGETWERSWNVIRPAGRLISIAVPRPPDRETATGPRATWFVVKPDRSQLIEVAGLVDAGVVRPVVSEILPLARGMEAFGPTARRSGPGKAVLSIRLDSDAEPATASADRGQAVATSG